jgi:hypothetical protein
MFSKSKVSQSMIDAVNSVLGEKSEEKIIKNVLLDEATEKVPTPTGMKVYGSNYGNSMKARKDQTSHEIDKVKGPKDKEMKEAAKPDFLDMDKDGNKKESMKKALADKAMKEELKGNQDRIDANHNNKIDAQDFKILRGKKKVKEGREFTEKLLSSINEKKDVVMPEDSTTPAKNQDVADKSYLKDMGKKPTVKSDLKNLGRFLTGKKETNEEVELDQEINEVLSKDATAGDYIHDFIHSDNPKFAGKSKAERKKMALGAYYGKQNEETNDDASITTDTLAGRLPGGKSNSFKSYKIGVKPLDKEGDAATKAPDMKKPVVTPAMKSHEVKEETVEEKVIAGTPGWEKIPKNVKDKSGAVHTPMSRAKDLARQSFKKLKNEMLGKAPGNN